MSQWRVAGSLVTLLAEVNHRWPNRDKASDGTIGDVRHQHETTSDHNPWIHDSHGVGVVRALDVDSGPGLNPDEAHDTIGDTVTKAVIAAAKAGHPAMGTGSYVIHERKIASAKSDPPWSWRPYTGSDPHTSHPHISVALHQGGYDSTKPWGIWPVKKQVQPLRPVKNERPPTLFLHMKHGPVHTRWTKIAQAKLGVKVDGVFGPSTRRHVIAYRKRHKLGRPFGWIGPRVWRKMGVIK